MSVGGIDGSLDTAQILNLKNGLNNSAALKQNPMSSLNNTSLHMKYLDQSIHSEGLAPQR
jgi:hypothetical protein